MWNSKPFVIFFSLVTGASMLFLFFAWRTVQRYDYFLHYGIKTPGIIVEHYLRTGSRGYGKNHFFVYHFKDSQARLHESQVIPKETDNSFEVGKDIEILYDPLDPSRNIPFIMLPENIFQPIYSSLKFMVVALGVTFAFGAFVFSRFVQTRFRWVSLKRLFGVADS